MSGSKSGDVDKRRSYEERKTAIHICKGTFLHLCKLANHYSHSDGGMGDNESYKCQLLIWEWLWYSQVLDAAFCHDSRKILNLIP